MKARLLILLVLSFIIFSCSNSTKSTSTQTEQPVVKVDSNAIGAIGMWSSDFTGSKSTIYIYDKDGVCSTKILHGDGSATNEILKKSGDKYLVDGANVGDYYQINSNGDLSIGDTDGIFSTAKKIGAGSQPESVSKLNLKDCIGKNVFEVKGEYSESAPKTLDGTNNDYWIVYYKDINVTFRTDKKTDKILQAKKGEKPNM